MGVVRLPVECQVKCTKEGLFLPGAHVCVKKEKLKRNTQFFLWPSPGTEPRSLYSKNIHDDPQYIDITDRARNRTYVIISTCGEMILVSSKKSEKIYEQKILVISESDVGWTWSGYFEEIT